MLDTSNFLSRISNLGLLYWCMESKKLKGEVGIAIWEVGCGFMRVQKCQARKKLIALCHNINLMVSVSLVWVVCFGGFRKLVMPKMSNHFQKGVTTFPNVYPTSALLGCVEVVDVIDNETYKTTFPPDQQEETGSEFLFICTKPQRLVVPQQMSGQHKICTKSWRILFFSNGQILLYDDLLCVMLLFLK